MIAVTSISPSHKNFENQLTAIKSWQDAGYKVISLNAKSEIEQLKAFEGVEFVETIRTNEVLFKRPYVIISSIIDHLKTLKDDYFLIINSDIVINDKRGIVELIKERSESGVVIFNRYDFDNDMEVCKRYELGFDGFFINKKWIHIFPQSVLCLGQCFWDYWLPYQCVLAKVPIFRFKEPYLFHKKHQIQYSSDDWKATGRIFEGEVSVLDPRVTGHRDVGRMSQYVYEKIKNQIRQ